MPLTDPTARIKGPGFIAALDQSGGSTPKALKLYGVPEGTYQNEEMMFEMIHQMRRRIMVDKAFNERIAGVILFEKTMKDTIDGVPTPTYLSNKNIVSFLKVDKGLMEEADGVQLMKEMPNLEATLADAKKRGVFGTKMRSVINSANAKGVKANVDQQFEVAGVILDAGLMPIVEPEVNIKAPDKKQAEELLLKEILAHLEKLPEGKQIMLKLTLPEEPGFYQPLIDHPKVLRVVALSGGYSRADANARLAKNPGMTASFSRALTEGLNINQSDEEFSKVLDESIQSIYDAAEA